MAQMTEYDSEEFGDKDLPDVLYCARMIAMGKPKEPKERPYLAMFRAMAKENPTQFMIRLQALEKDWYAFKIERMALQKTKAGEVKQDVGTEEALRVTEKLIAELTKV